LLCWLGQLAQGKLTREFAPLFRIQKASGGRLQVKLVATLALNDIKTLNSKP
jgi:hypothetical protein